MRKGGLEPPRYCYRQPLKLVRLPIPPLPQVVVSRRSKLTTLDNKSAAAKDSTSIWREAIRRQQKTETLAKLYEGKLAWSGETAAAKIFARTYLQGKSLIRSTGEVTIGGATRIATDWYLELRDRIRKGEHLHGRSFAQIAESFIEHADLLREVSEGQRRNYKEKWNLLKPHFDGIKITDIDTRFLLTLREKRSQQKTRTGAAGEARDAEKGSRLRPARSASRKAHREVPRRAARIPIVSRRSLGSRPLPSPVSESRTVGQGPKARKGAHLRTRPQPAHEAPAPGALLVHADLSRRSASSRRSVQPSLARLPADHPRRQGPHRSRA